MLYKGAKPAALYRGAYKPGKLYKGTQLVAGYADVSKAAPASWDGTYDDVMGVTATGKGKQQTYSGKNLLMTNRDTYTLRGVTAERLADGRYHISGTPTDSASLFLAQDLSLVLAAGTYTLARVAEVETLNIQVWLLPGWKTGTFTLGEALTVNACYIYLPASVIGQALDFVYAPQLETGSTPTAYEPYVGGKPSPSPDYPQPLVAAEGALTASGRTGTSPTTVTLPVLRAIPGTDICDTLAYIGGDQWQVTRRVGVVQLTGTETWVVGGQYREDKMDWYYVSARLADAVDSSDAACACTHYRHGVIANNQTTQGVGIVWQAIRVRYGDPPDGTDAWKAFLAAQAAAGDPVTIWYALATPTTETVTLGELPSYPVHTALAVSGDYPPDVTGTVKVSL